MMGALTLLVLAPLTVHAGLAGNEGFAASRKLSHFARAVVEDPFASAVSTISFNVADKTLMSPIGESMTRYTLDLTAGSFGSRSYTPVTVLHADVGFTCETLRSTVGMFNAVDDVWDEAVFMKGVVFQTQTHSDDPGMVSSLASCLQGWNTSFIAIPGPSLPSLGPLPILAASFFGESSIPQGPYIASVSASGNRAHLTPVYRVYRDEQQAFTSPTVPDATGNSFVAITAHVAGMATQSIPVPSRLYTLNATTPERPLEGMRVAVKDMFDMEGLRTGCGSRAYFNTYPPRYESAFVVKRLIELGAIIVGKDKTSQFANGESATDDWVDQLAPFNPRGDGYQDPQTSSAGSGAAMGAYEWLDFAIGSDTGGSVRGPAAWQGIYGLRPSHGAISLQGAMPLCSPLDSAGYFARDAITFQKIGKAWYGDALKTYPKLPHHIYMSDDLFPLSSSAPEGSQMIYNKFFNEMADFLNATIDTRSLSTIWNSTVAPSVNGTSFEDYLNTTYPTMIGYYQYTQFGYPFIKDFQAQNGGRSPFLDPSPSVRWAYGQAQGETGYNASLVQKQKTMDFISEHVLEADEDSCSKSLFMYPINAGTTQYRNIYHSGAKPPFGFSMDEVSPLAETPEMSIPIGQVRYNSTIDNFEEVLPVSIGVMARKGCDYVLLDLAAALQKAGIIYSVKPGRTAF